MMVFRGREIGGTTARSRDAIAITGYVTATIGTIVLIGWWLGPAWLTRWGPDFATMKPVTAVCFVLLGIAVSRSGLGVARGVAWLVATLTGLSLLEDVFGRELGIESWLAPRNTSLGDAAGTWRMAPATAIALLLCSVALAIERQRPRTVVPLAAGAALIAAFSLLGYLAGADALYRLAPFSTVALPTAVALLALSAAVVMRGGLRVDVKRPRPLSHLMLLLAAAVIGPLLLLGIFVGGRVVRAQLEDSHRELMATARTLSASVDREIVGEIETLLTLAASPSLRAGDYAAFQRQAEAALEFRRSGNVILVQRGGQQLVNTRRPFGTPLPVTMTPGLVEAVFLSGKPRVSNLFMGRISKELVFNIAAPVRIDDEIRYVLIRSPNLMELAKLVKATELPPGWFSGISDRAHVIVARSHDHATFVGRELSPTSRRNAARPPGIYETVDLEGRPSLQAHLWSDTTGWRTVVWAPKALVEGTAYALWRTIGYLALLTLGLMAVLGGWISRWIQRSMTETLRAAEALGAGRQLVVAETPVVEANALAQALRQAGEKRAAAEEALRASEQRYRAVFNQQFQFLAILSPDGVLLEVNDLPVAVTGVARETVIGRKFWDTPWFAPLPDMQRDWPRRLAAAAQADGPALSIDRFATQDGTIRLAESAIVATKDTAGDIVCFIVQASDITERTRAEDALRVSESRLNLAQSAAGIGIWDWDLAAEQTAFNSVYYRLYGLAEGTPHGFDDFLARVHPSDRSRIKAEMDAALAGSQSYNTEFRILRASDGAERWMAATGEVLRNPDGRPVRVMGVVRDVTARKNAEQSLRASEARYRAAFEVANVGKMEVDAASGRFILVNDAYCRIVGWPRDELLHMGPADLIHPDDRAADAPVISAFFAGQTDRYTAEKRFVRKDGGTIWVRVSCALTRSGDGRPLHSIGVLEDITDRKQHQLDLALAAERADIAQTAARATLYEYFPASDVVIRNASLTPVLGYAAGEIPPTGRGWFDLVHPEDIERIQKAASDSIANKTSFAFQYRVKHKDGHYIWVSDSARIISGEHGDPDRVIGMVIDISELKAREEQIFLLMKEVNHRAKNMLGLVQVIARQTAATTPKDFVQRFSERVQALAANQDLLVRNTWRGVELHDLVRAQLAHLDDLVGTRVTITGPPVRITPAAAQGIGMALHELATNAGKYGALSDDKGCVDIVWSIEWHGSNRHSGIFVMHWIEHGGPPATKPERTGFGNMVLSTMARMSVRGDVSLEYHRDGVRWHLSCPIDEALDHSGGGEIVNEDRVKQAEAGA